MEMYNVNVMSMLRLYVLCPLCLICYTGKIKYIKKKLQARNPQGLSEF